MYFKIPRTGFYKEIGPHRTGEILDLPNGQVHYLGIVDLKGAKLFPEKEPVHMPFVGWKREQMDSWSWLSPGTVIIGCLVEEGVFAVIDRGKPILRRLRT